MGDCFFRLVFEIGKEISVEKGEIEAFGSAKLLVPLLACMGLIPDKGLLALGGVVEWVAIEVDEE